ncbi:hypothetical protein F8S13_00945 [Chloroflexia bacterium SDU3-3]|nr:hypothetical protein F8S13_00945 [Chloroflexia bacterium SDU3-3]
MKHRMYYLLFFSLLLSMVLSQQAPAYAGLNEWTALGLPGGKIEDSAIDPTTPSNMYVAVWGNGVWRSSDGGATWASSSSGLPTPYISQLYIDPLVPTRLFSVTEGGLLYRSSDGGATWAPSSSGLPDESNYPQLGTMAFHPSAPGTIYITSIRTYHLQPGVVGVYRSTDGGTTWASISTQNLIISLVIDPTNPQQMYAGCSLFIASSGISSGGGILRSSDGGATWEAISSGLPEKTSIPTLLLESGTPTSIYALSASAIYKSSNSGDSWAAKGAGLPGHDASNPLTALAADPQNPLTFYTSDADGLYKTTNGADLWAKVSSGPPSTITTLMIHPASAATIYAGTDTFGMFRSADSGATWRGSLHSASIDGLQITAGATPRIYVASGQHLAASSDHGGTWRYADLPIYTSALESNPATPNILYAGGNGLIKIEDDGTTISTSVLTSTNVTTLALHPQVASGIYFSSYNRLFASDDSGATWAELPLGLSFSDGSIQALAVAPTSPATIYAATGSKLYRSADAGATWEQWSNAALGITDGFSQIMLLADQPQHLYARSGGQLYTSDDGGATWSSRAGMAGIDSFTVAAAPTPTIYAARSSGEVLRSSDDGATATTLGTLPSSATQVVHTTLAADPAMPNKLYVGTLIGAWEYTAVPAEQVRRIYLPVISRG